MQEDTQFHEYKKTKFEIGKVDMLNLTVEKAKKQVCQYNMCQKRNEKVGARPNFLGMLRCNLLPDRERRKHLSRSSHF